MGLGAFLFMRGAWCWGILWEGGKRVRVVRVGMGSTFEAGEGSRSE